jgi:predicted  nucleic acid-binding Zn ribbon protein
MNGQVLSSEFPAALQDGVYRVIVSAPERSALSKRNNGPYVTESRDQISRLGIALKIIDHGFDPESAKTCKCRDRDWMVLFTTYICLESPLRCGICFGPIPLYRLAPPSPERDWYKTICWQSDYRACDRLQMNCATGERFGMRELSHYDSSLSRRGREICDELAASTGVPVYYYLYRAGNRSLGAERKRRCPVCRSGWLIDPPLHDLFDLKCDKCRLVSNLAWNVR